MRIVHQIEAFIDRVTGWYASANTSAVHLLPVAAGIFAKLYSARLADLDLFARVAVGRLIRLHGSVPLQDPFAYTPTKPTWYDHEWLSGLIFYAVSRLGGDLALFLFNIALAFSTMMVLHAAQRPLVRERAHAAVWLALCVMPSTSAWLSMVRSQSFTLLSLALFLLAMIRYRIYGDTKVLAALPLVMVVWVNAHGGFVVGLGCLAVFAACVAVQKTRRVRPVLVCLLLCAAATLINPYGPAFLRFVFEAVTKDRHTISEWRPLDLFSGEGFLLAIVLTILIIGVWKDRDAVPAEGKLLLLLSLPFGIKHQRLIVLFYLIASVFGLGAFSAFAHAFRKMFPLRYLAWRRAVAVAMMAGVVAGAMGAAGLLVQGRRFSLRYTNTPVAAMEWLRRHREGGKLLVHFNEGSYALWRGYPRFTVSVDGRYEEVYPDSTVEASMGAYRASDPRQRTFLQQVLPDYILVCSMSAPGLDEHAFGDGWSMIYRDRQCRILSTSPNSDGQIGTTPQHVSDVWEPVF